MAENKTAKTPADGPEYERGFVDGMQRQMQLSVKINKEPTKIFGPGLEEILNSAGFYRKREWVGMTEQDIKDCEKQAMVNGSLPFEQRSFFARAIEAKLKERNT